MIFFLDLWVWPLIFFAVTIIRGGIFCLCLFWRKIYYSARAGLIFTKITI
ncbi:MAG: hypothetical protein MRERV_66c006 [Mycoplasmataceae bacterium RV_VA103A]|nr:MAG: hypothetical protein MRERV_66c006 [Mycoplasmataceae bacterium RV_VA103A]